MCELLAMSSRGPATVTLSLSILAEHGGNTAPHKDGWGIAFYDEGDARVLKDTEGAAHSKWVQFVEQQEILSTLVLSHIRLATDGGIATRNTQPFARELGGRMHVFVHNGHVPNIKRLSEYRSDSFRPIGDTDSETAFCALLERIRPLWQDRDATPDLAARVDVVAGFANDLGQFGPANFLYCDSEVLFAHGHRRKQADGEFRSPGLFWLHRQCAREDLFSGTSGVSVISPNQHVVLVASVPLTEEAWEPFQEGEVIAISKGEIVARVPAGHPALASK
jgi:predicted glutamine amidotransferase